MEGQKERLTKIITARMSNYLPGGEKFWGKFVPEFVDASIKYPLFRDNPDLLPTIFIQETSGGQYIKGNNPLNYGVRIKEIKEKFEKDDVINNIRNTVKEMGETGSVYARFRTGKPLTEEELVDFATQYESENPNYPNYIKWGRQAYQDIENGLGPTATPTPMVAGISTSRQPQTANVVQQKKVTIGELLKDAPRLIGQRLFPDLGFRWEEARNKQMAEMALRKLGNSNLLPSGILQDLGEFLSSGSFSKSNTMTQGYGNWYGGYYGRNGHEGVDYRAGAGEDVMAPAGWVVKNTNEDPNSVYGKNMILENPRTKERLQFAHLSKINYKPGDVVNGPIGKAGATGIRLDKKPQQQHLHVNYWDPNGKRADVSRIARQPKMIAPTAQASEKTFNTTVVKTPESAKQSYMAPPKTGRELIRKGDTLAGIAQRFNTSYKEIMKLNPQIKDPNRIFAGSPINTPKA